ncbi:MAG: hypothetical protein II089_02715 [Selenomonas sp.]|nr:hypothetical protein [Selenomonas sp.]MBQ2086655.1 hypothetical protein [Selenomonas sp.]
MRILQNLSRGELDFYTKQPTAKKLLEKVRRDGINVPPGDKKAAAAYMAGRSTADSGHDEVEISAAGYSLQVQEQAADRQAEKPQEFTYSRIGDSQRYQLHFTDTAMISRVVKQGYVELEGQRVALSDEVKKQLLAAGKQMQAVRQQISQHNFLLHETANARQTSDAMKEANDKMSRAMMTASRIMHGRKVSPADEKELMEFNKDLYAMAKNAASLERYRHKHDKDDDKISEENQRARDREAEPKDYSVQEEPMPHMSAELTVDLGAEMPVAGEAEAVLSE